MKSNSYFYWGFAALSAVMLAVASAFGHLGSINNESIFTASEAEELCIVIDAGHGGEDGGCVSEGGALEKELNLSVARKVSELLNTMGYNTIMTRTEDKMLYDMYGDDYTGKKKTYDLKNRLRFARENEADAFVSIHMNKFPQTKYSGLQVYYSKNHADSAALAGLIRDFNRAYLQRDNDREIKAADKSIYILDRIEMPAVLVECGFLSNPEETEKLCSEKYRGELSLVIAASIMSHIES